MQTFRCSTASRVIAVLLAAVVVSATVLVATALPAASAGSWWTAPAGNLPWQWYLAGPLDLSNPTEMGTNDTLPGGGAAPAPVVYDIDAIENPASTVASLHADGDHVICYIEVGTAGNYYTAAQEGIATTYFQQLQSAGDLSSNELQGYPEYYVDINQPSAVTIMESMIKQQCADKGFDAVETDLDETYNNNEGSTPWTITETDEQNYLTTLADYMHSVGLGWIEKNLDDTGDNFASIMEPLADGGISEQCNQNGTCGALSSYLGKKAIFNAEYESSLYPGFCTYDDANGINGALFDVNLDGPRSPCNGPAGTPASSTTLTTSLSGDGQTGSIVSVPAGTPVTDSATLSGTNAGEATGTITYRVYSNSTCTAEVGSADQVSITTPGSMPQSSPVSLTTSGLYYWQATYSGDSNNEGSSSTCGSEVDAVAETPASSGVTTSLSGGGQTGSSISVPLGTGVTDAATLSGTNAAHATGTVTYRVYSDPACSVEVGSADPVSISTPGTVPASSPVALTSPGTYYWQASYSGDALNLSSTSTCGAATAVTLGEVSGTVLGSGTPVQSAEVDVCPTGASGSCQQATTAADGTYTVADVPNGTYTATVLPPSGSSLLEQTSSAFAVSAPAVTTENFSLVAATPPPVGTVVTSPFPNVEVGGVAVPVIPASIPVPISATACSGGSVTATISGTNAQTGATQSTSPVSFVEKPAGSGTFTGTLPAVEPILGTGTLTITVGNCPDTADDTVSNSTIFIDPSGTVLNGWDGLAPVSGATVTLLTSTSLNGTYSAVANGSLTMSAGNRVNPYTTSTRGLFGWDTVPGFYEIRVTKAGCGTASTKAAHVPPTVESMHLVLFCPGHFAVTTRALPAATIRTKYRVQLRATGGATPFGWKIVAKSGTLPKGLTLSSSGVVSGTPVGSKKSAHTYTFRVSVTTTKSTAHPVVQTATRTFTLVLRV